MNPLRSFRLRLVFGLFLGAMGLLALTHLVTVLFLRKYRVLLHANTATLVAIFAILFLVVGLLQIRGGLSPFDRLRARLAAVRQGKGRHVDGSYPSEVQPLVSDLNELLDHREEVVRKALAKAGDLAHGLKTPLAVLTAEAARAEQVGQTELASAIRQQVERMNRQVEYHLAHARAAASGAAPGAHAPVHVAAEGLARTMLRLHVGRGLSVDVRVPTDHVFRGEAQDLDEMLGNILDNACKWARSRVAVSSVQADGRIIISIEDDGPGLDPAMWEQVLQRGVRADEASPGSGFGLAIVRELAELYGGSISLDRAPAGGVRARLELPSAGGSDV